MKIYNTLTKRKEDNEVKTVIRIFGKQGRKIK